MDPALQQLCTALENAKSPNDALRRSAAEFLINAQSASGFVAALFRVAVLLPDIPLKIRQMAAINCKQATESRWTVRTKGAVELPEDEKAFIREHILDALTNTHRDVRVQLELVLRDAVVDFPHKFGHFGNKVMSFLTSNEPALIYGGLVALRTLCRALDPIVPEQRALSHQIVDQVFPLLYNLLSHLSQFDAPDSAEMQLLIVKTMWAVCSVQLPPYFQVEATHAQWMQIVFHLMSRPEPASLASLAPDQRAKAAFWKVKKWIGFFFRRQLNRYSRIGPKETDSPNAAFAPIWMNNYSVPTLNCLLGILHTKRAGSFVPERIVAVIIDFLNVAIMPAITWQAMQPIMGELFRDVLFPLVCFTQSDWERFQEDPAEWIRMQQGDAGDEELWGSQYVSSFIVNLVRYRTKEFLINVMDYIVNQVMAESNNYAAGQPRPADVLSRKFGALDLFASLGRTVKKSKSMKPHLEQILANHVLPELRTDCLFLRAKACQVFSVYYNVTFQNPQIFVSGVEMVLANVTHEDECVRGQATIALHLLIQSDLSRDVIHHVLPNVIDVVFNLVDTLDNQDIVKTLESLIATFPDDIVPRAVDAIKRLSEHWFRLVSAAREDPNDDISAVTALHIGGAIATLCDACAKTPQIYPLLEPYVIPICQLVLKEEMTEYLDEVVKILVFLSLHETPVSENVWNCFPGICNMLTTWAADYVAESLAIFDNLIARSTDKFLSSGALEMVLNIYTEYVTNTKRSEYAAGNASQIMEVVLVYCRGRVDNVVPHAIRTALQRYSVAKSESLRVLCLEVVANAIIYNPQLALGFLESQGFTNDFFTHWLNTIMPPPKKQKKKKGSKMRRRVEEAPEPTPFTRLHDKQVCIMALSSIFQIPIGTLPASIQQFLPGVLACILKLQDEFEVQRAMLEAEAEEEEDSDAEEDATHPDAPAPADHVDLMQRKTDKFDFVDDGDADDNDGDADGSFDEDGFDDEDGDDGFFHVKADDEGNYEFGDDQDAEDEQERIADEFWAKLADAHEAEFDFDDDEGFSSQLDEVDPVIYFIDAMHAMTQRDGALAQQLIAQLSERQQKMLNTLDAEATKRKNEQNTKQ
eukprot:TRINITY_DN4098_c0_g1_i2.p1 TRINITY_DN4098_c0_g1~~TRINITY_DN4098_c0_g1_i2.p1  ORF type:complete len:1094 (+),score=314.68 TRINITY_DN4098_c0_g1_i2:54-3335(+)